MEQIQSVNTYPPDLSTKHIWATKKLSAPLRYIMPHRPKNSEAMSCEKVNVAKGIGATGAVSFLRAWSISHLGPYARKLKSMQC